MGLKVNGWRWWLTVIAKKLELTVCYNFWYILQQGTVGRQKLVDFAKCWLACGGFLTKEATPSFLLDVKSMFAAAQNYENHWKWLKSLWASIIFLAEHTSRCLYNAALMFNHSFKVLEWRSLYQISLYLSSIVWSNKWCCRIQPWGCLYCKHIEISQ